MIDEKKIERPYSLEFLRWALGSVPSGRDRALRVLLALVDHANKKAVCWPSRNTIAAVAYGIDREQVTEAQREQVRRALVWLRDEDLITYGHNPIKGRTIYRLQCQPPVTVTGPVAAAGEDPVTTAGGPRHGDGEGARHPDGGTPRHHDGPEEPWKSHGKSHGEEPERSDVTTLRVVAIPGGAADDEPTDALTRLRRAIGGA